MSRSQIVKKNRLGSVLDPLAIANFMTYGFGIGFLISILVPHPVIVGIWTVFFLLPTLLAFAIGIVGCVLGSLGCK